MGRMGIFLGEGRKGRKSRKNRLPSLLALLFLPSLAACDSPAPRPEPAGGGIVVVDDAGREVRLPRPARRVVSLLPAGTETFLALGVGDRVVGRTRYDVDPRVAHLPSVGGGLDPSLEALVALRPELVVAFETAGGSRVRARLEELGVPVFGIQTQDTADVYRNIAVLGRLVGREAAADSLTRDIRARLGAIAAESAAGRRPRVLYVASVDPPHVAGAATFIAELIGVAGGEPLTELGGEGAFWPQVSLEAIVREDPDVVMLPIGEDPTASVERLRTEPGWRELAAVREGRVATVPADLVNRPGPAIAETARVMREALRALPEAP